MMDMRGGKPGCARCRSISMLTGLIIFWAFFRIWEIPFNAVHGLLGHFNPALPFSPEELQGYGFRFDASWQTVPYIREDLTRFSGHIPEK